MSGGHFNIYPTQVGDEYGGQWCDAELNELFCDLFGNGYERYRGPYGNGSLRKMQFGRVWSSDKYSGGLAETLDLWLSCDIDEEDYREQVAAFKDKWFRRTPRNRVEFYTEEITDVINAMRDKALMEMGLTEFEEGD